MVVKTQCRKCGVTIRLDFGDMTKEEAITRAEKIDRTPRECPGGHVELTGMGTMYWGIQDAIRRAYDLGEGEDPEPVMTDKEFVQGLLTEGRDIIDGGANKVPKLALPSIHDLLDLEHIGFGNFQDTTHVFLRCDSPRATPFYDRVVRHN